LHAKVITGRMSFFLDAISFSRQPPGCLSFY
jgi:hypothetical protein